MNDLIHVSRFRTIFVSREAIAKQNVFVQTPVHTKGIIGGIYETLSGIHEAEFVSSAKCFVNAAFIH